MSTWIGYKWIEFIQSIAWMVGINQSPCYTLFYTNACQYRILTVNTCVLLCVDDNVWWNVFAYVMVQLSTVVSHIWARFRSLHLVNLCSLLMVWNYIYTLLFQVRLPNQIERRMWKDQQNTQWDKGSQIRVREMMATRDWTQQMQMLKIIIINKLEQIET